MRGQNKGGKTMCPRTGRPPKAGISRNKKLNVRLTDDELLRIEKCAEALDRSRTDTLMYGIHLIEAEIKKK